VLTADGVLRITAGEATVDVDLLPIIFDEAALGLAIGGGNRKRRRIYTKNDWWAPSWGQMLTDPAIRDINSREGQEFRRRYRIPAPFFLDWLIPEYIKANIV
jgi:hypothetical protein